MSKLDLNEVVANMADAVRGQVATDWKEVRSVLAEFMRRNQSRWELLSDLYVNGVLSEALFLERLKDEERVLEAQLHAIMVIKKVVAQNAANAAIKVLEDAAKAALKAVI